MLYIVDQHGLSIESDRDPVSQRQNAMALIRRAASLIRDNRDYSEAANKLRRSLDALLRENSK